MLANRGLGNSSEGEASLGWRTSIAWGFFNWKEATGKGWEYTQASGLDTWSPGPSCCQIQTGVFF